MRATLLHLRFPFVYILSPIFVWGAAWGPGSWTARTTLGFLLVHLALYPGANAFNSAFDRDTGPIGGLARPPDVPAGLGRWSTWLQGAGAALALVVGPLFAAGYAALWGIFTAYSHPRTRWKRSPVASTAAIVAGQGGIGYWLGWSAAGPAEPTLRSTASAWTAADGWALAAACAVVAALYPLTQVYQLEADRARRDRTLAAALGPRGTLAWSAVCFAAAAGALMGAGTRGLAAFAAGAAVLAGATAVAWPAGRVPSHREVMAAAYATSTAFLLAIVWSSALGTPA
jgi:1,4-dihydroxy-2-naphthoate octaprenyltransferase